MLPDTPQFAVSVVAAQRAVFTCVNVNRLCTPRQLRYQLNDSGVAAILATENFAVTLADVIRRTPVKHLVIAFMGDLLGSCTESGAHLHRGFWAEKCPDTKCQWAKNSRRLYVRKRSLMNQGRRSNPRGPLKSGVFLQCTSGITGLFNGTFFCLERLLLRRCSASSGLHLLRNVYAN